ncbi:ribonuclease H-like domain-containing protein [Tanacetum coccineum]
MYLMLNHVPAAVVDCVIAGFNGFKFDTRLIRDYSFETLTIVGDDHVFMKTKREMNDIHAYTRNVSTVRDSWAQKYGDAMNINADLEEEHAPTGETSAPPAPKTAKQLDAKRNQERVVDKAYDRFQKLISQLEVHGAPISKEDINQKFLRSLPPSWSQIALIMRNTPDIHEIDIDDLYNNLRVYEDEMKRSSSSTSTSQNLEFLSSETLEIRALSCTPTTSPQLENEDFRWQVAMLTVRCYNYHRKGHFARECRSGRNQGKRSYGDNGRSNAPTNESSSQALVAQDGLGGYDWSNDFEVEPVNYALMAISSSSSQFF